MHFYSLFSVAALLSSACAQLSNLEGVPNTNGKLDILFNSTSVRRPGQLLNKATTATEPQIGVPAALANNTATFMFVMLDLDVPPQQGGSKRRVLLHALHTGLKATRQRVNGSSVLLASSQKGPAEYLPPSPPATDTVPHRYVQLLFDQPANLNIPASTFANRTARFNFDVNKFMSEHSLSRPVAGTFFTVDGRSNSTGGGRGSPTGTGGGPRRTSEPFRGAGHRVEATSGFVLMLAVLAVNVF